MKHIIVIIIGLISFCIILIIINTYRDSFFNKNNWSLKSDMEYPYRAKMLHNLLINYSLLGHPYSSIKDLLGEPNEIDSNVVFYKIKEDFGYRLFNIDPVSSTTLSFTMTSDSIIINYKLIEWKKTK